MKDKRQLTISFSKLYMIFSLVVLAGCVPGTATPIPPTDTPTDEIPTTTLPSICVPFEGRLPQSNKASNGFFVDYQMIVTGPKEDVDKILGTDGLIVDCDLSFLSTRSFNALSSPIIEGKDKTDWAFTDPGLSEQDQRSSLVMRLYEFPLENIELKISDVNNAVDESGNRLPVFADPNYLTSPLQDPEPCGLPYSGGGSGGGRTFGAPGVPTNDVSPEFMNQWALGQQGADLPAFSLSENDLPGDGVRIGVFDTSPFADVPILNTAPVATATPFPAQPTDLKLNVLDAITVPLDPDPTPEDVSDHGLFAAGLIHAIAPGSEIHLIQVLNKEGCGTLFDITSAIQDFTNQMSFVEGQEEGRYLDKVVFNLSLGIHKPDEESKQANENSEHPVDWKLLLDELISFETAIYEAHAMGAIIIASSGNDSGGFPALPMQLPAAYDTALGVAATNMDPDRSCYSNRGDVAAPGGDGGQDPNTPGVACVSRAASWETTPPAPPCDQMGNCQYGLVSLSLSRTGGAGYIYWVGTSFSAPLVSGLAALTLQGTGGNPARAVCLIEAGAQQHPIQDVRSGMIDIDFSLNSATCP